MKHTIAMERPKLLVKLKSFLKNYLIDRKAYRFFMRDWIRLKDLQPAADMMSTMRFSQNLQPQILDGPSSQRILVIAPHPDDETIGPGGTLLKAINKGADVLVVYLTNGKASNEEKLMSEAKKIAQTYQYQTKSLGYYSKNIPVNQESATRLSDIINEFSPDTLFLPFLLDDHDDHRRASHLLNFAHHKGLITTDFEIWAYQVYTNLLANVIVDITDVASRKKEMISHWTSQNKTRNWPHYALGLNAFNQRFLNNEPSERYAECFFVLPLNDYLSYCRQYFNNIADCYYHEAYQDAETS